MDPRGTEVRGSGNLTDREPLLMGRHNRPRPFHLRISEVDSSGLQPLNDLPLAASTLPQVFGTFHREILSASTVLVQKTEHLSGTFRPVATHRPLMPRIDFSHCTGSGACLHAAACKRVARAICDAPEPCRLRTVEPVVNEPSSFRALSQVCEELALIEKDCWSVPYFEEALVEGY